MKYDPGCLAVFVGSPTPQGVGGLKYALAGVEDTIGSPTPQGVASVFPGGLIEFALLTPSGNCPPGDPGTGSPFH